MGTVGRVGVALETVCVLARYGVGVARLVTGMASVLRGLGPITAD